MTVVLKSRAGTLATCEPELAERLLNQGWVEVEDKPVRRADTPDRTWKVAELKEYATDHGVDLGDATKKDDILSALAPSPGEETVE